MSRVDRGFATLAVALMFSSVASSAERLERIVVAPGGKGFVTESSGRPFFAWGFNYDHDEKGRLIEEYWQDEWSKVRDDFREIKALGANVARIHLQLGAFMETPEKVAEKNLNKLRDLVALAEEVGVYLDLTGLACYRKKDVPSWYDVLGERERWSVQERFWKAVAGACAGGSAIFCYDLMNEPVVSGGPRKPGDWLGPPFAGLHFVQFVSLDPAGRPRPDVASKWIATLVDAIRSVDKKTMITVGLVDWSLERPGLTSGFPPRKVADRLDFVCVHLYPEKGQLEKARETLRGFSVGKPVVIEETFPLKSGFEEFREFLEHARSSSSGVIGFYWGKTLEECRASGTIGDAIMAKWLETFREFGDRATPKK